ncbi:MAG: PleD family two-component system response regulator [Alphaproteobacteria bacterium]
MSARILLVDDHRVNLALLEARLAREYYQLLTAMDGPAALALAASESPDLILLDVMMPGMDGFEVCRRLKADARTAHIPVVMVTALTEREHRVEGLRSGADDFLTKPVNEMALIARSRSLIRLKQMTDEWRLRAATSVQLGVEVTSMNSKDAPARLLLVDVADAARIPRDMAVAGHCVEVRQTIADGLEAARAGDFDAVMIGLRIGSEDGLQLCAQLRSLRETRMVPILLIVEEEDLGSLAKGLDLGVTDYIIRPIDANELLARVRTQVRRKRFQDHLREDFDRSLSMAFTDSLTGLYNRRYLSAHLQTLLDGTRADGRPIALAIFDIDHFKSVNDAHGHAAGDMVLVEVGARLSAHLRNFDLVARYGGEEFVAVLPNANAKGAVIAAERLRKAVAATPIALSGGGEPLAVTVSVGVAIGGRVDESPDVLIERADRALYVAKAQGRNQVVIAEDAPAVGRDAPMAAALSVAAAS